MHEEPKSGTHPNHQVSFMQYKGPLPPPAALEHYNKIIPNFAERLLSQFEVESTHNRNVEIKIVKHEIALAYVGQMFAFVIALFGLGAAAYVGLNGSEITAAVIGGGTLVAITTAFLYGRTKKQDQR